MDLFLLMLFMILCALSIAYFVEARFYIYLVLGSMIRDIKQFINKILGKK
jgi:hypothetical protein